MFLDSPWSRWRRRHSLCRVAGGSKQSCHGVLDLPLGLQHKHPNELSCAAMWSFAHTFPSSLLLFVSLQCALPSNVTGLSYNGFVVSHHRVCHAPGLLCYITGSVMPWVCCVTSQGLSCHRFVMSYHRVCHKVCHAPGLLCHITGCVTPQVCCVTSQGLSQSLSCHSFFVSHHRVCHRVCHATGLLCYLTGSVTPQVCCVTSQGLSCHRFVVLHHRVCWKARWEYAVEVTICKSCHLPFTAEGQYITFMLLCWTKLQGNEKWMHVWLHQALKWGHMSGLTVYQTLKCEHAPCLTVCQALK